MHANAPQGSRNFPPPRSHTKRSPLLLCSRPSLGHHRLRRKVWFDSICMDRCLHLEDTSQYQGLARISAPSCLPQYVFTVSDI